MVRVSTLEAFRQFLLDEEAEAFDPNIPESDAMRAGTAFHAALEVAEFGSYDVLEAMGYRFFIDCDISIYLPPIREVRAYGDYAGLIVTGKLDALNGRVVIDHKTTAMPNMERFIEGCQWRFYLDLFDADAFRWNVFTMKPENDETGCRDYTVRAFDVLEQRRYPGMHNDCANLARRYLDYHEATL